MARVKGQELLDELELRSGLLRDIKMQLYFGVISAAEPPAQSRSRENKSASGGVLAAAAEEAVTGAATHMRLPSNVAEAESDGRFYAKRFRVPAKLVRAFSCIVKMVVSAAESATALEESTRLRPKHHHRSEVKAYKNGNTGNDKGGGDNDGGSQNNDNGDDESLDDFNRDDGSKSVNSSYSYHYNDSITAAEDAEADMVQRARASWDSGAGEKSTIARWGILAESAMERARGDLILMSQADDFSDSVGYEAVGPAFVLSLLMLDLRRLMQPEQGRMPSLLNKYRQRLRDLVSPCPYPLNSRAIPPVKH
jgi:hypothetical protein